MNSIAFPNMFSDASTNLVTDRAATVQNLLLTLKAEKTSLFGDPYFGSNLKKLIFEQNNAILRDIVIDDIYNCITHFLPQISVKRDNIIINANRSTVYVTITARNLLDFKLEEVNLALFNIEEME